MELKRGGTTLTTIAHHVLWLECACGRNAPLRVDQLLAMKHPPRTVADAVALARCRHCNQKDIQSFRIVYEPASDGAWDAMRGAEDKSQEYG